MTTATITVLAYAVGTACHQTDTAGHCWLCPTCDRHVVTCLPAVEVRCTHQGYVADTRGRGRRTAHSY